MTIDGGSTADYEEELGDNLDEIVENLPEEPELSSLDEIKTESLVYSKPQKPKRRFLRGCMTVGLFSTLLTGGIPAGTYYGGKYLINQGKEAIVEFIPIQDIVEGLEAIPEGIGDLLEQGYDYVMSEEDPVQEVELIQQVVEINSHEAWTKPPEELSVDYVPELSVRSFYAVPFPEQRVFQTKTGTILDDFFRKIDPFVLQAFTEVVINEEEQILATETNQPVIIDGLKINGLVANLDTRGQINLKQVDITLDINTTYTFKTTTPPLGTGEFSGSTKQELIDYLSWLDEAGTRVEDFTIEMKVTPRITYVAQINENFETTIGFQEYNIEYQNPVTSGIMEQQEFFAFIRSLPGFNTLSWLTDDSLIALYAGEDKYIGEIEGLKRIMFEADEYYREDLAKENIPYVVPAPVSQPYPVLENPIEEFTPEWYSQFLSNINEYVGEIIQAKADELSDVSTNVTLEQIGFEVPDLEEVTGIEINPYIAEPEVNIILQAPEELRGIIESLELGDVQVAYFTQ